MKRAKRVFAAVLSAALLCSCLPFSRVAAEPQQADLSFAQQFASPQGTAKPYIRWWVTPGLMNEQETKREIRQMAEAGFGGIELVAIVSMAPFGSDGWNQCMKWALEEAAACGITLDFTIGQGWPVKTPAVSDPDDVRSEQGLFYKNVAFTATEEQMTYQTDLLPFPDEQFEADRNYELVAVTAAKQIDGKYDPESVLDITDSVIGLETSSDVSGASLSWTAPEKGDWTLFYLYRQGISAKSSTSPVIDHFSRQATEAVTGYWDSALMAGELASLYENNGGNIFCDSLELGQKDKDQSAFWSQNLLEEFKLRRGYDLTPYLPAIFISGYYPYYSHQKETDAQPDFDFGSAGSQVREDFYKTLTELFTENHVSVIRDWANSHNMQLRYQVYGACMEVTEPSLATDIVETESWGHKDTLDMYRTQSGVVHMNGSGLYSTESAAVISLAWAQTWTGSHRAGNEKSGPYWSDDGSNYVYTDNGNEDAGLLYHYNRQLATGVNRIVLHGFSYKSSMMQSWPGDSFMSMGNFPNEWDDKTPMWEHIGQMTDYLSRVQYVMQKGQADVDLAVYRNYNYEGYQAFDWSLNEIEQAGYTYDFISPALLNLDHAVVTEQDGRMVLAADGPSYKALILDQRNFTGEGGGTVASSMPVDTAEKILGFAQAGLPVVIVGEAPSLTGTFNCSQQGMLEQQQRLASVMQQLEQLPTVAVIESRQGITEALAQQKVAPDASKEEPSALLSFHRTDSDADYYYLYNSDLNTPVSQSISLKGEGRPYLLDPWSGEITPVAQYTKQDGRITLSVDLQPNSNLLVALAEDGWNANSPKHHITDTTADQAVFDGDSLALRATRAGEYTASFDNGLSTSVKVKEVPQPFTLDRWSMTLSSWSRGDTPLDTLKTELGPYELDELKPWNELEGLQDVAGVATYTATFDLAEGWDAGLGAEIDFGRVSDTMQLTVNGLTIPNIDQLSNHVDIGRYLQAGKNTVTVQVTSNLANVKSNYTQEFGLIGPVTVTPYRQVSLSVPQVDKGILEKVIDYAQQQADSSAFDQVIPDVQASFASALQQAKEVYRDGSAVQQTVDLAWQTLMTEIHKLGFVRGDKTSLRLLIETAEEFQANISRYTPATAAPFTEILNAANGVYDDENAMQSDVAAAENNLLQAMLNLRYQADKSILEGLLAEAAKIDRSLYTSESMQAFDTAKDLAEVVFDNPDATQSEVDDSAKALQQAIEGLQAVNLPSREIGVQSDSSLITGSGNVKTGDASVGIVFSLFALAGVGLFLGRRKK